MYKLIGYAVPPSGYGFTGAGASVQINNFTTGAAATLYLDNEATTKSNPLTADSTGKYEACVPSGYYNIIITYASGLVVTHTKVLMWDSQAVQTMGGDKNLVINGGFDIWQRTSADIPAASSYHADRWAVSKNGAVVVTSQRSTDCPTELQLGHTPKFSWNLLCTTGMPSPGAGDYLALMHQFEGNRWRKIGVNQGFAVSLWVKASKTGSFCISFTSATGYSCARRVTINASDTWEKKTAYFPSPAGAFACAPDNTSVMALRIGCVAGTTFTTPSGNDGIWLAGGALIAENGDTNFVSSVNNYFRVTDIQVEAGSIVSPFEFLDEASVLLRCQRYHCKSFALSQAEVQGAGYVGAVGYPALLAGANLNAVRVPFPVTMRAVPTVTLYNPTSANAKWYNSNAAADSGTGAIFGSASESSATIQNPQVVGDAVGHSLRIHFSADAEF